MSGKDITLTGVSNLEASQNYLKYFFSFGELILVSWELQMCCLVQETSGDWWAEVALEPGTQEVEFNKLGYQSTENSTIWKHYFFHVDLIFQKL